MWWNGILPVVRAAMTREGGAPSIAVIGGGLTGLMTAAALSHTLSLIHISEPTRPY